MKKILGLLTALLLATPVMADVAVTMAGETSLRAWVVIDDEVYYCRTDRNPTIENPPICYGADMKD
jgi:hypothetical protein